MFFIVLMGATSSYFIYYSKYGKLARYFLVNMFRFPSSYGLMVLMFGIKPLLKGAAHALLYDYWEVQILFLLGIEGVFIIIMAVFEFVFDNYKSILIFMGDFTLSGCMFIFNVLILLKYNYFKDDEGLRELLEECI